MGNPEKRTNRFKIQRHRHGVCHRCGWSGSVTKVGRRLRAQFRTSQVYGRLCDECIQDLLRGEGSARSEQVPGSGRSKVSNDLDVA